MFVPEKKMSMFFGSGAMYPGSPPPARYATSIEPSVMLCGCSPNRGCAPKPNRLAFHAEGRHSVELSCCEPQTWKGTWAVVTP